jgi:hypothetical protein
MTIQQFVKSLPLDLIEEEDKRLWKFIAHHLEILPEHVRPIHCTDFKRLSLAVKYEDRDTKAVAWQCDAIKTQAHIVEMGSSTGTRLGRSSLKTRTTTTKRNT